MHDDSEPNLVKTVSTSWNVCHFEGFAKKRGGVRRFPMEKWAFSYYSGAMTYPEKLSHLIKELMRLASVEKLMV